jgi:hypothetical protein
VFEDAVFECRELNGAAVQCDCLRTRVQPDGATLEDGAGPPAGPAQQCLHARQHFFKVIGLRDVIVGARLQPFDLVLPAISRRQDEDYTRQFEETTYCDVKVLKRD